MYKYIDISTHQKNVDYAKVKADGVVGVLLRVGHTGYGNQSMYKDELFEKHYKGFREVGIPVGVYWFSRANTVELAKKEALLTLEYILGKEIKLPVYFDTEDTYYQSKISKNELTVIADIFCKVIADAGYTAGIYASKSWLDLRLDMKQVEDKYEVWVAQYNPTCTYKRKYQMWQYTSQGRVKGIVGNVDINDCYKRYHDVIEPKPEPIIEVTEISLYERTLRRKDYGISSPFGMRLHPVTKVWTQHDGVDVTTKLQNWNCYALEDGIVYSSGYDTKTGAGNYVWVEYNKLGYRVCLFHLKERFVKKGQRVTENTILGTVGSTGTSTNTHLHLGVRLLSTLKYIDPETIKYSVVKSDAPISGVWDDALTVDLQTEFGSTVDGIISGQKKWAGIENIKSVRYGLFGSQLVRNIQKKLNIKITGQLDKETIKAIQKYFDTTQDGFISENSQLVKAMRLRKMNTGRYF